LTVALYQSWRSRESEGAGRRKFAALRAEISGSPDTRLLPSRNRAGIHKGRRHTVTPVFLISSALEIFLVLFAGVIFLTMIVAAVAAVVWFVAGLYSATHETPTGVH
jgi:hypothetical protein